MGCQAQICESGALFCWLRRQIQRLTLFGKCPNLNFSGPDRGIEHAPNPFQNSPAPARRRQFDPSQLWYSIRMRDRAPKLAMLLKRLLGAVGDVKQAVQKQTEAAHAENLKQEDKRSAPTEVRAEVRFDQRAVREAKAEQDRAFANQKSIKRATWAAVGAAVIYAGVAACQAYQLREATEAAQISAEAANKQLELVDRAWVKVTSVKVRSEKGKILALSFQDISQVISDAKYQATLQIEINTANVGHSPALNVHVFPYLFITPFDADKFDQRVSAEEKRICDSFAEREGGIIIFPSDTFTTFAGAIGVIHKEALTHLPDKPETEFFTPVLIGCVDYQSQASPKHHQTRFVYEIFHAHGNLFLKPGEDISADKLQLVRIETDDYAY